MQSLFETLFEDTATGLLHDQFSEASGAIYNPAGGGASTTVAAIVGDIETRDRYDGKTGVRVLVSTLMIEILETQLARSSVGMNGTFTVGGVKYSLRSISDLVAGAYEVTLVRESVPEVAREGYRR
jgi:hypothetical protein